MLSVRLATHFLETAVPEIKCHTAVREHLVPVVNVHVQPLLIGCKLPNVVRV